MLSRVTLLYDGNCAFCKRSLDVLSRFDVLNKIDLIDANDSNLVTSRFPSLPELDFHNAMFAIDAKGRIYRGFDAFRAALWASPILASIAWTWYVPGVRTVGTWVYERVATNRHVLGCASSCALDRTRP